MRSLAVPLFTLDVVGENRNKTTVYLPKEKLHLITCFTSAILLHLRSEEAVQKLFECLHLRSVSQLPSCFCLLVELQVGVGLSEEILCIKRDKRNETKSLKRI